MSVSTTTARKRKLPSPAVYGAPTADYGPAIRHLDIVVPAYTRPDGSVASEGFTREATVTLGSWPDPENPERRQDVAGAIAWLPLRFYRTGDLTSAQIIVASRYRDHLEIGEGVSNHAGGVAHKAPWDRTGITDIQIAARKTIEQADKAMGRETTRVVRAFVGMDTLLEVSFALGIARRRVLLVATKALDDLDAWWGKQ